MSKSDDYNAWASFIEKLDFDSVSETVAVEEYDEVNTGTVVVKDLTPDYEPEPKPLTSPRRSQQQHDGYLLLIAASFLFGMYLRNNL